MRQADALELQLVDRPVVSLGAALVPVMSTTKRLDDVPAFHTDEELVDEPVAKQVDAHLHQ